MSDQVAKAKFTVWSSHRYFFGINAPFSIPIPLFAQFALVYPVTLVLTLAQVMIIHDPRLRLQGKFPAPVPAWRPRPSASRLSISSRPRSWGKAGYRGSCTPASEC